MVVVSQSPGNGLIEFPEFLTVMARIVDDDDTDAELREVFKVTPFHTLLCSSKPCDSRVQGSQTIRFTST